MDRGDWMIVNESFKKGFVTGLSMNPLYVGEGGTPEKPKPLIRLEFNGNLDNTGTDKNFSIVVNGVAVSYADGFGGKKCYDTSYDNEVKLIGDFAKLMNSECTYTMFVKCNPITEQHDRRFFYMPYPLTRALFLSAYRGSSASTSGRLEFNLEGSSYRTEMPKISDGIWRLVALIVKKNLPTVWVSREDAMLTVERKGIVVEPSDTDRIYINYETTSSTKRFFKDGFVQDFRVYDRCLSYEELREIAKECE